MKPTNQCGIPLQSFLPLFCLLILSTTFNAFSTWNDFQMLSGIRKAKESELVTTHNEVPLNLNQVLQFVEANPHYGMSVDDEWDTLSPSNHATGVHVGSVKEEESPRFISVYNQLACLNTLRRLYMNPGWSDDVQKQEIAHHCLNVLRQAVLCNGDTTLEPSHLEEHSTGKESPAASGMDVLHVCRNWEDLLNLTEEDNFANNNNNNNNNTVHHSTVSQSDAARSMY